MHFVVLQHLLVHLSYHWGSMGEMADLTHCAIELS